MFNNSNFSIMDLQSLFKLFETELNSREFEIVFNSSENEIIVRPIFCKSKFLYGCVLHALRPFFLSQRKGGNHSIKYYFDIENKYFVFYEPKSVWS